MIQTIESSLSIPLDKLKLKLHEHYQDRLESLLLYDAPVSQDDVEFKIVVVLKGEVNPLREIKENSTWLAELCLESDTIMRCIYLSCEQFQNRDDPFIGEIKRYGIEL
ncbi:MAG: nucleotidyltransferase domain-containing protein [Microcystaceae cyanobacterium]